ncbi:olfactory receptor 5B21-like [Discoglossus pictus]
MDQKNLTHLSYFVIKGISDIPELQTPIFLLILFIYLIILGGNMTILLLICLDPHLHTPMYFFLGNLSLLDMSSTTVTLQTTLVTFRTGDNTVSFLGCMSQMYIFSSVTSSELLILAAMSYDRYAAICNPLHYHIFMNIRVCLLLITLSWIFGFMECIPHVLILSRFTCYRSNLINHFYCDLIPLMNISCSDTSILELVINFEGSFICTLQFLLTFIPYIFIIVTILKIQSNIGRRKAFYTCSSHLTVIVLLYTTIFCQYLRPSSIETMDTNKLFSLFNTVAVPILNPFIYSLKNKDVKSALRRRLRCCEGVR